MHCNKAKLSESRIEMEKQCGRGSFSLIGPTTRIEANRNHICVINPERLWGDSEEGMPKEAE